MKPFSMYVITDTHYFSSALGCRGEEYDKFMQFEQKCFAETQAINEAAFAWLEKADGADTVLIAGDLSFNGEKQSHTEFLKLLKNLKKSGKRIFVITAGHDFNDEPFAFDETGRLSPEGTKRDELFDMYYDYGFSDAAAVDRESLSYVAQLTDGVRLLALNNDGNYAVGKTYPARQIEWILRQTKKAREDGQMMIAMNHYPLIPGSPVLGLVGDAVMKNAKSITELLADEGVHLCFTGHMHNQSVKLRVSEAGNRFWDVCTGSLIGCPAVMRFVTVHSPSDVEIKTLPVPDFKWDFGGLSQEQYFTRQFDMMINTYLDCLADDPERLCGKLGLPASGALCAVMRRIGGMINTASVGSVCKMLLVKCPSEIKKSPLRPLITDIVRNIFVGDAPFVCGTPEYEAIMGVFDRIYPLIRPIEKKLGAKGTKTDIRDMVVSTIGKTGVSDYDCRIKL